MKFDLRHPCDNCPFRTDVPGYIREERAVEIASHLVDYAGTFSCHKTNSFDDEDGCAYETERSQHCAGALIFLTHQGARNSACDPGRLNMDAPVFGDYVEFVEHHAAGTNHQDV